MRLAAILVHYHTPDLAAAALDALRADVAGTGLEVEWLLVDNGSDAEERAKLAALPARLIDPGRNLGYAGGVNLGVASTEAELILLMNPDVLVLSGCVPALVDRLRDGTAVAGPAFFWDRSRRLLLPPAERRTRRDELTAILSRRGEGWAARARRRWRRHARRHWEAREPLPSHDLSGSLIALSRPAWEAVGPFDEGFRLFFEETDWLLRARDRGVPSWYVPGAQAVHLYNQSAGKEPRAKGWFEDSARRFRRRHYGPWFAETLENLDSRLPRRPGPRLASASQLDLPKAPVWVEVSPNPEGFPAAAERVLEPGIWRLPEEIREPGLIAQVTDADGREILRRSLEAGN
ncbi:MAG TPA: glycosyltransferase family 2 protein [Thermoanaerobaculia bacterium]